MMAMRNWGAKCRLAVGVGNEPEAYQPLPVRATTVTLTQMLYGAGRRS